MLLVFDLDDTLYLERDYVRSGFAAVSEHLAAAGIPGFLETAWDVFEAGARGTIFNRALQALGVPDAAERVAELVGVYRSHLPSIRLCDDVLPFLRDAAREHTLGLLSDGPVQSQRSKVEALRIPHLDRVLLTDAFGQEWWKPSRLGFGRISEGFIPHDCVYVADNPDKDFQAPLGLGWSCYRMRRPGGLHRSKPLPKELERIPEISSLQDLSPLVAPPRETR